MIQVMADQLTDALENVGTWSHMLEENIQHYVFQNNK